MSPANLYSECRLAGFSNKKLSRNNSIAETVKYLSKSAQYLPEGLVNSFSVNYS